MCPRLEPATSTILNPLQSLYKNHEKNNGEKSITFLTQRNNEIILTGAEISNLLARTEWFLHCQDEVYNSVNDNILAERLLSRFGIHSVDEVMDYFQSSKAKQTKQFLAIALAEFDFTQTLTDQQLTDIQQDEIIFFVFSMLGLLYKHDDDNQAQHLNQLIEQKINNKALASTVDKLDEHEQQLSNKIFDFDYAKLALTRLQKITHQTDNTEDDTIDSGASSATDILKRANYVLQPNEKLIKTAAGQFALVSAHTLVSTMSDQAIAQAVNRFNALVLRNSTSSLKPLVTHNRNIQQTLNNKALRYQLNRLKDKKKSDSQLFGMLEKSPRPQNLVGLLGCLVLQFNNIPSEVQKQLIAQHAGCSLWIRNFLNKIVPGCPIPLVILQNFRNALFNDMVKLEPKPLAPENNNTYHPPSPFNTKLTP